MAIASPIDVPLALRHAHDEVLLALFAETFEAEALHRRLADDYVREAVLLLSEHPRREYDWSGLDRGV